MSGITPVQRTAVAKALKLKIPFALYAQPGENDFTFCASLRPNLIWDLCPEPVFFLGEFAQSLLKAAVIPFDLDIPAVLALDRVSPQPPCLVQACEDSTDELDYKAIIYAVIFDLQNRITELDEHGKVVISRIIADRTAGPDSLLEVAETYFAQFPNTFRYIAYHHTSGVWVGATPEVVIDYNPDTEVLQTEALAGTMPVNANEWDRKNRQEHNMVKEHILDVFARYNVRIMGGKKNLKTDEKKFGRLRHLWTPIRANVPSQKVLPILTDLAPTPAVGGYPREHAIRTILTHELHLRRCYGGCVGVLDRDMRLTAYANLRCALAVYDDENKIWNYNIYAGGGITADSDPILEWWESGAKAAPLCRVIQKINTPKSGEDKKD